MAVDFFTNLGLSEFFIYICGIVLLIFVGLISGITIGLMSRSVAEFEALARHGSPDERECADIILPVMRNQHLLICTLVICNVAALEAAPILLDIHANDWVSIVILVISALLFGEIIPRSISSPYGLTIGALATPFIRLLLWTCGPVAYPVSKLLDCFLGHPHEALFPRAGNGAEKYAEIKDGTFELRKKTSKDAMTPISEIFAVDIESNLHRGLIKEISNNCQSEVPVYSVQSTNIIGVILIKDLLGINLECEAAVKSVTIRRIPRVPENMPLHDILEVFEQSCSNMAVVVRQTNKAKQSSSKNVENDSMEVVKVDIDDEKPCQEKIPPTLKWNISSSNESNADGSRKRNYRDTLYSNIVAIEGPLSNIPEEEEVVGIITRNDVFEEAIQG